MAYRVEEYYSPEAKAKIAVLDAIKGQADLRYQYNVPKAGPTSEWQSGYREFYWSLMHTLGETSAHINITERNRIRNEESE